MNCIRELYTSFLKFLIEMKTYESKNVAR